MKYKIRRHNLKYIYLGKYCRYCKHKSKDMYIFYVRKDRAAISIYSRMLDPYFITVNGVRYGYNNRLYNTIPVCNKCRDKVINELKVESMIRTGKELLIKLEYREYEGQE